MAVIGTSSVNTYQHFEEERNKNQNNAILNVGIGAGVLSGANYLLKTDAGQNVANRVFKLNTTNDYFRFNNFKYQDIKIKKNITLGDIALDFSKTLEEVSPLKILRTFHVSSFISPYTIPNSNLKTVFLSNEQLLLDQTYIKNLISENNPSAAQDHISDLFDNGGKIQNGKLLTLNDQVLLDNVKMVNLAPSADSADDATHPFLNRIYEKFRNIYGAKDKHGFIRSALSDKGGIGIIAGKSEADLAVKWARAYGRLAVEPGFKLFDRPLDILAEVVDKTGLNEKYGIFEHLRDRLYLGAGAGGDYTQSVPRMFYNMGKNIAGLTIAGAIAYNYADKAIRTISPDESPFSEGIMEGVATGYVNARIGIASMWSDNFQEYKAKQEELAEESTSLSTLAGFPLAGALLGANIGYFTRVKNAITDGVASADIDASLEKSSAVLNSLVGSTNVKPPAMNRVGRFASIGAVLASIPVLPFLPGALIGESSEELRKKYSGEEDVEIRSTRFWGSGGSEWEGGKIKYFTKSWYAQLMNDAEDIGKYGDQSTKDELNPVLNPFDYLRNPYRLEERNQDQSPYATWGMEVSYGSVFGKLFQATLGSLIKPTIVNERLEEYIESGDLESNDGVELKQQIKESEQSLIDSGMMLAPEAAKLNTKSELANTAYSALTDFAGLKGWMVSMASDELHTGAGDPGLQLGVSGEMNNSARGIIEANIGGAGLAGESLRRFIPTNAGSVLDRANPLRNQMPCLLKGTEVVLEGNTLVKVENLKIGDMVISDTGSTEIVTNIGVFKTNKSVELKVYGTNLYNFKFSWNHPILIYGKGYVNAEDVNKNDYVAYPITKYAEKDKLIDLVELSTDHRDFDDTYIYYGTDVHKKNTKIKRFWDDIDLFYLFGVYAAEGSKSSKNNGIKLSGAILDKWDVAIERIFEKYNVKYSKQIVLPGGKNYIFYANPLRSILTSLIPGKAHNKVFDKYIIDHSNSKKAMMMLLKGLIDGDGYYIKTSDERVKLGLHTVSENLAYQTRNLFIDIYSVSASVTAERKIDNSIKAIHVSVNGSECARIASEFGYVVHNKTYLKNMKHSWTDGKYVYIRVKSVLVSDEEVDIYAQEVSGNHTFCVSLFATHNTWLPHDIDNFYIDFSSGDPYQKIEKGYYRLPGAGYAAINPELKDINPEDYSYIQRFKILSDVAVGSDEYYQYKDIMDARYANNQLTDYEKDIYLDTIDKLSKKSIAKDFYTAPEGDNGLIGSSVSKYWKMITSLSESPTESLTFLRPSAKFIHQRTAVEDYEKTQIYGSDNAMWTSPYSDFIKPTINDVLISENIPEETLDRRGIDEYFDKLEYIKYRKLYKEALKSQDLESANNYKRKYESTIIGSLNTGLDENMEVTRAYIALPDNEKPYFGAFSNMTSEEDRVAVINMQSPELADLYSKLWKRKDALIQNDNPEDQAAAIRDIVDTELDELISNNKLAYAKYLSGNNKDSTFQEYLSDIKAEEYIKSTTGMPDSNFYGWDPRIEINDIKLKTLTLGKEDVRRYGFWEGDEERLRRLVALDNETQVVNSIEEIKSGIRQEKLQSAIIKSELYHRGISADEVRFHRSQNNNTNILIGA